LLALALLVPGGETARAQVASNVILRANVDSYSAYNDVWGYTDPNNGNEYALLGTTTGLSVVNIVNRNAPYETGFFPGANSTWRDIKTFGSYAYVTNESSGGIAIIDLSDPENPVAAGTYTGGGFSRAHNLYIDTATGLLYSAGANLGVGGTRILDLSNPTAPAEIGNWEGAYFHDVMVQNGRLYGSAINNATLYVLDVTNPASIATLGTVGGYPNAFTHNAWVTPDDNYVMTTDETAGAACRMWDLSGLPNLVQTAAYLPNAATIPHNTHIVGDLAVISHYELGVRIVDVGDPYNLTELGYYDTWPSGNGGGFNGCWGAYPFFANSPNIIVASDLSTGLYVLEFTPSHGTVAGTVTHEGLPVTIAGADVELLESANQGASSPLGTYRMIDAPGAYTLQVSAYGYLTSIDPVSLTAGVTTNLDVELTPAPGAMISGTVTEQGSGTPIPGAVVEVLTTPLRQAADGSGDYTYYSVPVGSYTVRCDAFGYNRMETTVNVANGSDVTLNFALNPAPMVQLFEAGDGGWTTNVLGATTGMWEHGDPQGTGAQPEDDHTASPGVDAWITQLAAGTSVGSFDIDNGAVELYSSLIDVTGMSNPHFAYHKWYVTGGGGNPSRDDWVVEVSSDQGNSWALIERTDVNSAGWELVTGSIGALVTPSTQILFRFTAQDTGSGSITEAGVDDFAIFDVDTLSAPTDAPVVAQSASVLALGRAAPNPFRAGETTQLTFSLPAKGPVTAVVYDVSGRRVAEVADDVFEAGAHRIAWDGRSGGKPAPAGVYFVKLRTASGDLSRKMVLVR
jgi:choice-of-anchor B domain-containing protein